MCLSNPTKNGIDELPEEFTVYKTCIRTKSRHYEPVFGKGTYHKGINKATSEGFHLFLTREDAEDYACHQSYEFLVTAKVKRENVLFIGEEKTGYNPYTTNSKRRFYRNTKAITVSEMEILSYEEIAC